MRGDVFSMLDRIHSEWLSFNSGREHEIQFIRPQIIESWRRCRLEGVNPHGTDPHSCLDASSLDNLRIRKERLIQVAKPFMANLYEIVKGSGFVVVLTDENGFIMEMLSDRNTLQNPMTSDFLPGASWHERDAGTNAIGTALALGDSIQVSGAEHFCEKHHCLTCSSAPIFDPDHNIIGVLDMSGASHASHLHTLGMVVAAAEAIMAQLRIQRQNRELAVVNNRLSIFFNAVSDGVLIVDKQEVVIEMNPAARSMLGKSAQNVIGKPARQLLESRSASNEKSLSVSAPFYDIETMLYTNDGVCHCLTSGEPVVNEMGEITGGIVILRPIKHVQKLVNRFSGYHATFQFSDIIGESVEIREAIRLASLSSTTASNVLLQGESGTGKEIFAQSIHNKGALCNGPFVALNCGAIPRELIGSELFGYEEGAFSGAKRGGKPGKFELAAGGTLFLDEIGDMPLEHQIALLRVIQEKKMARIGGDKMIQVNVRLICATNKNLLQEVSKGTFRQDLFYRLNVMQITIPPLRSRAGDIPLLFSHFLDKLGRDWGCKFDVELDVFDYLMQYDWPGNVRELQNVVERAASLSENGVITVRQLPTEFYSPFASSPVMQPSKCYESREQRQKVLKDAEKIRLVNLLNIHAGNISRVAKELGLSRKTVYSKMRLYAIQN